jgi:hypothetical protein
LAEAGVDGRVKPGHDGKGGLSRQLAVQQLAI